eukprot:2502781-Rhodomonas_salina.1
MPESKRSPQAPLHALLKGCAAQDPLQAHWKCTTPHSDHGQICRCREPARFLLLETHLALQNPMASSMSSEDGCHVLFPVLLPPPDPFSPWAREMRVVGALPMPTHSS